MNRSLASPAARSLYADYLQRLDRSLSRIQDTVVGDLRLIAQRSDFEGLIDSSSGCPAMNWIACALPASSWESRQ